MIIACTPGVQRNLRLRCFLVADLWRECCVFDYVAALKARRLVPYNNQ